MAGTSTLCCVGAQAGSPAGPHSSHFGSAFSSVPATGSFPWHTHLPRTLGGEAFAPTCLCSALRLGCLSPRVNVFRGCPRVLALGYLVCCTCGIQTDAQNRFSVALHSCAGVSALSSFLASPVGASCPPAGAASPAESCTPGSAPAHMPSIPARISCKVRPGASACTGILSEPARSLAAGHGSHALRPMLVRPAKGPCCCCGLLSSMRIHMWFQSS